MAAGMLCRVSSLPFQKLNDEVLIVDPKTREVHLLNATATRIWDLLASPRTVDELLAALAEEFEAPTDRLRPDVESLLGELGQKGLVGADPDTDLGTDLGGTDGAGA